MQATIPNQALPATLDTAHSEIRALRRAVQAKDQVIVAKDREITALKAANTRLTRRYWWQRELNSVPHRQLSATDKLVLLDLYEQQETWQDLGRSGPQRVYCEIRARGAEDDPNKPGLGLSPQTYGRTLQTLHECALIERTAAKDPITGRTQVSIELQDGFWRPGTVTRPAPRQQGSARVPRCPDCGADTPIVERRQTTRTYICTGCGTHVATEHSEQERELLPGQHNGDDDPTPDEPSPLPTHELGSGQGAPETGGGDPTAGLEGGRDVGLAEALAADEDPTPADDAAPENHSRDRKWPADPGEQGAPIITEERVLKRLDTIAGNCPRHIALNPTGPHKYDWQKDQLGRDLPLTRALLRAHLAGTRTVGSELRWLVGPDRRLRTYALSWDADSGAGFAILRDSARPLWASGARPVLEKSPSPTHPGGGRLWLFFAEAVEPGAAWATALTHAPALAGVREYWPNWRLGPDDRGQAVRLPAGVYHRDGVRAPIPHAPWRPEGLVWHTGRHAAALLITELTPAHWVTEPAPPPPPDGDRPPPPPSTLEQTPTKLDAPATEPAALGEPDWLARYGQCRHTLPFAILPREAIAWYNARHDIRQLLPKEANGYARASWRGERTPSVGYLANNAWIDYGDSPHAREGKKDGGDAFEALCRLSNRTRGAALELLVLPEMLGEARAILETAAHSGADVPGWVAAITTPAGHAHYRRLRDEATPQP